MIPAVLGEAVRKGVELIGPIVIQEVSKPRFRRFVEDKFGELAVEIARRRFTPKMKKSKKFIMRRGRRRFECRMVN